ncbi:MAG: CapA family protein [Acidimicrobiia bacterium]|nr:CapA family protein [Acidimicrobiia bacterium]
MSKGSFCAVVLAVLVAGCAGDGTVQPEAAPSSIAAEGATATTTSLVAATTTTSTPSSATSTTSSPTTTTTTLPPITLGFAGDTSFTHGLHARDPLGEIADALAAPDLMILNLETTVAEPDVGRAIQKKFTFKSPPISGELLANAGVDVAALANNHALDYGPDAVIRTIEILNQAGVATVGTGESSDRAYRGIRVDVNGWDLAILSFSRVPCDSPEPGETYIDEVAWACPQFEEQTTAAVADAADADFTVVMVHWGVQSQECPAQHQHDLAARWIASGADAVIGSHPHVLQGVEQIDGKWVVHSTGNFAFPSARNASSYSAIFVMTVSDGGVSMEAKPIRIQEGRPVPAISSRAGILEDLTELSFSYGFGADGVAVESAETGTC